MATKPMSKDQVYFCVDRDKLTGGIQLSIDDANGGYRIAGPKYSGLSVSLIRHPITKRDVEEIRSYLKVSKDRDEKHER